MTFLAHSALVLVHLVTAMHAHAGIEGRTMQAPQSTCRARSIDECVTGLTISARGGGSITVIGAVGAVVGAARAGIPCENVTHSALDAGSCVNRVAVQARRLRTGVASVVAVGELGVRAHAGGTLGCS